MLPCQLDELSLRLAERVGELGRSLGTDQAEVFDRPFVTEAKRLVDLAVSTSVYRRVGVCRRSADGRDGVRASSRTKNSQMRAADHSGGLCQRSVWPSRSSRCQ